MLIYVVFALALVVVFYLGIVLGEARSELKITEALRRTGRYWMPEGSVIDGIVR